MGFRSAAVAKLQTSLNWATSSTTSRLRDPRDRPRAIPVRGWQRNGLVNGGVESPRPTDRVGAFADLYNRDHAADVQCTRTEEAKLLRHLRRQRVWQLQRHCSRSELFAIDGGYLTYKGNSAFASNGGKFPDENFARELMQLFTIGLWELKWCQSVDQV